MVKILDATLREGEQTPKVKFSFWQKLEIAKLLDKLGVDFIEIGNPSISEKDKKELKKLAKSKFKAKLLCHCRAKIEDIENALETDVKWAGLFAGVNQLSLKYKFKKSKKKVLEMIIQAISFAKNKGLKVRFTIEDSSRTNWLDLKKTIEIAEKAGADRISLADTVGILTPFKTYRLIKKVKKVTELPINIHCHNDLGMAVANSLTAFEAGADLIDVSVNGLGERNGIASLSPTLTALKLIYQQKNKWDFKVLPKLSKMVAEYSGLLVTPKEPIDGFYSFCHKAGLHTSAVLKSPKTYQFIPPELFGLKTKLFIDELTSQETFRYFLEKVKKMKISEKEFLTLYQKLKQGKLKKSQGFFEIRNK